MSFYRTDQELLEKEFNTNHILPIDEMIAGDKEIALFLDEWLKNGLNASAAYKILHPNVSDAPARVLGSKKLTKINISAILAGYDLGYSDYILGLKEGLVDISLCMFSMTKQTKWPKRKLPLGLQI